MTLIELVQVLDADQTIMVRRIGESEMIETTPADVLDDYKALHNAKVNNVWASINLYRAIMIDLDPK